MPRAKSRALTDNNRAQLGRAVVKCWQINDTPKDVADRMDVPIRRVMEAMRSPIHQVMKCCSAGYTLSETVRTTNFPREFCLYVMKRYYSKW